jgi:peptidoglycan/LPS O-acetylase OafA/YrhL
MRYSPPLDGIRAIAILAVLLFHISAAALPGGFTGVDVFFVLSGFLITSIILHDLGDGCFSLREFYLRRIQRLLPNILVTVLAVLLLSAVFMPPSSTNQAAHHGIWTIFNLSNFYIWKDLGGYWGSAAEWSPLTHTWSLAIEEQFYLLFPSFLVLLAKFQPGRVRWWLIGAAVLSFLLCLYGTGPYPAPTFYFLPTRVWELLLGAVLGAYRRPLLKGQTELRLGFGVNFQEATGLAGLAMILLGYIFIRNGSGFPGLESLAPTVGTGIVLLSVIDEKTRLSRMLSSPFMVKIGKLSYSLYLWHWPLIIFAKSLAFFYGVPQIYGSIAGCVAGVLLGWIAFVCVERPLRRRGPGRPGRFAVIAIGFAITAVCCVAVMSRNPVADPAHRFDPVAFYGELYTAAVNRRSASKINQSVQYYDVYFPPIPPSRPADLWRTGGIVHLYRSEHPRVVVLGSSHALMYSKVIDDICREKGISVAFLGVDATPVFFNTKRNGSLTSAHEAREFDDARRTWLREWHPDAVFIIDRWDERFDTAQEFDKGLRSLLTEVAPETGRVIFVTQVPPILDGDHSNLRELVTWHMNHQKRMPLFYPDQYETLRHQEIELAEADTARFPNLRILRADQAFYNQDGSIRYESGRTFFYADGNHLSEGGAEFVRGLFESAIAETNPGSSSQSGAAK